MGLRKGGGHAAGAEEDSVGNFAKSFILETAAGSPMLQSPRRLSGEHQIEVVGEKLRAMMP